jgi:hypothetical protein
MTVISDVLSDVAFEIRRYLADPTFVDIYGGDLRKRIIGVADCMDQLRGELDALPQAAGTEPRTSEPDLMKAIEAAMRDASGTRVKDEVDGASISTTIDVLAPKVRIVKQWIYCDEPWFDVSKAYVEFSDGRRPYVFALSCGGGDDYEAWKKRNFRGAEYGRPLRRRRWRF